MDQVIYDGRALRVRRLDGGIAELIFDRERESINKFDVKTVDELRAATRVLTAATDVRGVLVTSAKDSFIVGADIYEFSALFTKTAEEIAVFNAGQSAAFTVFEDLLVPIVAAINGFALGGGFEMALTADYRVAAEDAQVGLPEANLGLIPGYGGTVRLPRLIGAVSALEWIMSGKPQRAAAAQGAGAIDRVAQSAELRAAALAVLEEAIENGAWRERRCQRIGPAARVDTQAIASFKESAKQKAAHYPAALSAVELIEATAGQRRDEALRLESVAFGRIANTTTASALVQIFVNDQLLKKQGKAYAKAARRHDRAAVLGAGIMGGGIAFVSALRGVPVRMKDIAQSALDLGKSEARNLLDKQVGNGRLSKEQAAAVDAAIVPQLDAAGFDTVDIVIEAVVESMEVKKRVLAEVESRVAPDAIIASNTSSLSITEMAGALARPQNFGGLHFFNPVAVMPLVEVIRGPQTSDATAASLAAYAVRLGKTPVVVKDGPGFLVNRILNAYFVGFLKLVRDGANFEEVDRVMEAFGWPMGPAYLQDVIGMDTSRRVFEVIAAGYPQRMALDFPHAIEQMVEHKRYGQKNGLGFYRYEAANKGRPLKRPAPDAHELIAAIQPAGRRTFAAEEIVDRLMLPIIVEAAICLEEGVAQSAADIDMSLVLGLGFPRHWGGALKYADLVGLPTLIARCDRYAHLGAAYHPTIRMRERARSGTKYF